MLTVSIGSFRPHAVEWLAVCYALLTALSTIWTVAPFNSAIGLRNTLASMVLLASARAVVARRRDVWILGAGLLAGCLLGFRRLLTENRGVQLRGQYDATAARLGIEGLNYNYLAYSFVTGIAILAMLVLITRGTTRHRPVAVVAAGLALLLWVGVLLNGTRGAVIAAYALGVWWLVARRDARRSWRSAVVAVVVAFAAVFSGVLDATLRATAGTSDRERGDLNGRLSVWPDAREEFWDHPFLGRGVDSFAATNPLRIAAHNALLDVGTGLGVLGIVLFVALIWQALKPSDDSIQYLALGGFLVASAPILLTGFWIESPMFWLALGLFSKIPAVLGRENRERRERLVAVTDGS